MFLLCFIASVGQTAEAMLQSGLLPAQERRALFFAKISAFKYLRPNQTPYHVIAAAQVHYATQAPTRQSSPRPSENICRFLQPDYPDCRIKLGNDGASGG